MNIQDSIAEIQLEAGEIVRVLDLYVRPTYGNLLAGLPGREFNERLLQRIAKDPMYRWHEEIEALVIPPPESTIHSQLPAFCLTALLDSPVAKKPEFEGSKRRVVWFVEAMPENLVQHIQETLKNLDWRAHARDYQM